MFFNRLFVFYDRLTAHIDEKRVFASLKRGERFTIQKKLKAKRCGASSHIYTLDGEISLTFKTKGKSKDELREAIFEDIHDFFLSFKFRLQRHRYGTIYGKIGSRFLQPLLGRSFSQRRYSVYIQDWFHDEVILRVGPVMPRWGILDFTLMPILKLLFGEPPSERFWFKLGMGDKIKDYFTCGFLRYK